MKQIQKNKIRYGRVVFTLSCAIFLIAAITIVVAKPDPYKEFKNVSEEMKQAGTLQHLVQDETKEAMSFLHYPVFEKEGIDQTIHSFVKEHIADAGISFLDYESTEVLDRYISIHFTYQKMTTEKEVIEEQHTYLNFDKQTGNTLAIQDVLRRDYQKMIADKLKEKSLTPEGIEQMDFAIHEDGIYIYQNQQAITVSFDEDAKYIRLPEKSIAETTIEKTRNRSIDPNQPMIALTFDDGPSIYTQDFLTTLIENDASATFFMLGKNIANHPEIVKRMVEEDIEIANHSWDHQNTDSDDAAFIQKEIYDTQDALFRLTGHEPMQFRPPYGAHNKLTDEIAAQGNIHIALWTVDTQDWNNRSTSTTLERARAGVQDGAIILFHDLYPSSLEAIQALVPQLKAEGYQLVTFSEIIQYKYAK